MSETEFSWNRYAGFKTDIVTDTKQRSSEKDFELFRRPL